MHMSPSTAHNRAFSIEMKPAYIGLHNADNARIQMRQQAISAIDYTIQQIQIVKSLPRGNLDWKTSFDPLDIHLTDLTKALHAIKRAPLETRIEAKALGKLIYNLLTSTPECKLAVRTTIGLKAQQLKMTCKKFRCYMKKLPETIAAVGAGTHPLPIKLSFTAHLKQLLARIYYMVAAIFNIPKPIDRTTFNELLEQTKNAEKMVRKRIGLAVDSSDNLDDPIIASTFPLVKAFTEASSPQKYTFGDVLRRFRNHIGSATATFLRAFIEEHLPYGEDIADLDPIFDVIAEVIDKSSYRTLDVILDESACSDKATKKQIKGKWSAEIGKASLSIAEYLLDMIPADQEVTPVQKARLLKEFKNQFTRELAKLNAIPDNATLDDIRSIHDAPIIVCFIADIIGGIQGARLLHKRILSGEINSAPQDAERYAVLALAISKIEPDWLTYGITALWIATLSGIRSIVTNLVASFQLKVFNLLALDNSLTEDQRKRIVDTVPKALKILNGVDFHSPQNRLARELFIDVLNVINKGVIESKPQAPKKLAIQLTEALSQLIAKVVTSERSFTAGIKAVVDMGQSK